MILPTYDGRRRAVAITVAAATVVVESVGLSLGWYAIAVLAGIAVGLVVRNGWITFGATTVLTWTALMLWHSDGQIMAIADLVGTMLTGQRGVGWLILVVTYLLALGSALAGVWLGAAARRTVLRIADARSAASVGLAAPGLREDAVSVDHDVATIVTPVQDAALVDVSACGIGVIEAGITGAEQLAPAVDDHGEVVALEVGHADRGARGKVTSAP